MYQLYKWVCFLLFSMLVLIGHFGCIDATKKTDDLKPQQKEVCQCDTKIREKTYSVEEALKNVCSTFVLELSGSKTSIISNEIGQLKCVEVLSISSYVNDLPEELYQLKKIFHLVIRNTNLKTLSDSLGNLTELQDLWLSDNELTSIPSSIGQLKNLKTLELGNNRLRKLPKTIQELKKLKVLSLENNPIGPAEKKKIKEMLPHCLVIFKEGDVPISEVEKCYHY